MYDILGIAAVFFLISAASVYFAAKSNKARGIAGKDINKPDKRMVAESSGIGLLLPVWIGVIWLFLSTGNLNFVVFGALLSAFALIGFFDDMKHKFSAKVIPWKARAVVIAVVALAFASLYAPGLLWIVPIALFIAGLAGLENTFAGLNGWEVGSGFIVGIAAAFLLFGTGLFMLAVVFSASILGLLFWNKYPARAFPGDSGTLVIGSGIAGMLVLSGRIELMLLGLALFLPHIFDFFVLKMLASRARDATQVKTLPYKILDDGRIYIADYEKGKVQWDFAKLILRIFGPLREWQVVAVIWAVVAANSFLVLLLAGYF